MEWALGYRESHRIIPGKVGSQRTICYGLNCDAILPPNIYGKILTAITSECDYIWRQGL